MSLRTRCFSTSRTVRASKSMHGRRVQGGSHAETQPWPFTLPKAAFDDPLLTGSPYIDLLRFFRQPGHIFLKRSINQYDDFSHSTLIFARHTCRMNRAESYLQAAQKRLQFATQPELKVVRFLCCYHERLLASLCSITPFERFSANCMWLMPMLKRMLECWRDTARREEVRSLIVETQILNMMIRADVEHLWLERTHAQVLPVNERYNAHMKEFRHIHEQLSRRGTASERKRTRSRAKIGAERFSLSNETTQHVNTAYGLQLQRRYLDMLNSNKSTKIFELVQQEPNMLPTLAISLYLEHLTSLIHSYCKDIENLQRDCFERLSSTTRTVVPTAKTRTYGSLWRMLTVPRAKQYLMREELIDLKTELYEFSLFKVAHTDSVAPVQLLDNSRRLITQLIQNNRARHVEAWLTVERKTTHSNQYHQILPHAKTLSEGPHAYLWRDFQRRARKAAQKDGSELPCGADRDANRRPDIPRRAVNRSQKKHREANTSTPSHMDREGTWHDHASDLITAIDRLRAKQ